SGAARGQSSSWSPESGVRSPGRVKSQGMSSRKEPILMRLLAVAVAVGALLTPSWTFAQAAQAPRPGAPTAPAAPRPQAAPQPPPIPPAAFQAGMKYAYIRLDLIAAASSEG